MLIASFTVICVFSSSEWILVDVIDGEDDYYWVYDSRKGIYHSSCVGGWTPLKGFIKQEDYDRMVRIWNLNNIEKAI